MKSNKQKLKPNKPQIQTLSFCTCIFRKQRCYFRSGAADCCVCVCRSGCAALQAWVPPHVPVSVPARQCPGSLGVVGSCGCVFLSVWLSVRLCVPVCVAVCILSVRLSLPPAAGTARPQLRLPRDAACGGHGGFSSRAVFCQRSPVCGAAAAFSLSQRRPKWQRAALAPRRPRPSEGLQRSLPVSVLKPLRGFKERGAGLHLRSPIGSDTLRASPEGQGQRRPRQTTGLTGSCPTSSAGHWVRGE